MSVLISAADLRGRVDRGIPPVLLDVRWALGDPHGRRHYTSGHIPGAVYVDLDTDLTGPASPRHGRHPLPSLADLQSAARRWGIDDGDRVVVYDATAGQAAARAWWLLRWGGLSEVAILDGGLQAWTAVGGALTIGVESPPAPGTVTLVGGGMPVIDIDGAAEWPRNGALLDARAGERYRGETEPVDPRAGHIPGAISAPTSENVGTDGRFLAPDALRERFAGLAGGNQVAVYCGSGVTAAHQIAALAVAGIDAALYPGSWSQWSNDPDRPAATGA